MSRSDSVVEDLPPAVCLYCGEPIPDEVLGIRKRRPSTVTRIVREINRGGDDPWNAAKHVERQSQQKKVLWSEVMDVKQ